MTTPEAMLATIELREWVALKQSHADLLAALRSLTDEIEFSQLTSRLSDPSRRNVEVVVLRARAAIARVEGNT